MALFTITAKSTQATRTTKTGLGEKLLDRYEEGGGLIATRFYYKNETGGTIAADSIIQLCRVGPCLILPTSFICTTAFGSSRTLDVGLQEYTDIRGNTVAGDIDCLLDGLDVASAVAHKLFGTDTASETYGQGKEILGQTDVVAKVIGGTMPNNGIIQGIIFSVAI